ncbi:biotin-dependent carboxyltransferase family protein [Streptomyces sp. NBC_01795]|uniref:5-oxoprolinase subunit C family protein n=1 Tax=unclassified Streptomyces TaxID=2593676 RepID=UPI002DDBFACC|nr:MULTISPECIES: allophanate hydrolase [unclassified Streptomyces]WSA96447.1 biotin-dependent carboxyltransferase family protein [Streptomyces sp. NBC_01795]WSS10929.1 biotin-dependent carboxyltransferase family protein [Streptomyces sp. NBC_01186]
MAETLTVRTCGLTTVQDLGRVGRSRYGLPANGAVDQHSARVANVLCGNHERDPLLEITALDFACTTSADILIAVTGAPADLTVDGVARPQWEPLFVRAGETVRVSGIRRGLRVYLAVLGSLKADYLQGSCAPDTILGFGSALRVGEQVGLRASCPPLDHPFSRIPLFRLDTPAAPFPDHWIIDVTDGPDRAEFGTTGSRLFDAPFTVSPQSNHIGLRLHGEVPRRVASGEVLSRGVPIGAVEVPAGDELLVLHRGRGVTAGYPVLGVVTATGLSALGQVRPGQRVRFRHRTLDQAVTAYRTQRGAVAALKTRVRVVFDALRIPVSADG